MVNFICEIHRECLSGTEMHKNQLKSARVVVLLVLVFLTLPTEAKRLAGTGGNSSADLNSIETAADTRRLEERLAPFFESVIERPVATADADGLQMPTQAELFLMVRHWDRLSSEFKKNYALAFSEMTRAKSHAYTSPSGRFSIEYETSGPDSVDGTDSYGYGVTDDWRIRTDAPNGIPDYVDEVAWAFDSSWSMEVDRFGLVKPAPVGGNDSLPYVVQITTQPHGYYGRTLPDPKPIPERNSGFGSVIQIRQNWIGDEWNVDEIIDYENHPEKAVGITAAHEFLHAIQYAMSHTVSGTVHLDHYPISWLEASAVLMEELAFDYVNDYIQYIPEFFSRPTASLFDDGQDYYKNVLFLMYAYFRAHPEDPIAFVKDMLFRNHESPTKFHKNLTTATSGLGLDWTELHGAFWASTYFTGDRADTSIFLKDAALMPEWTYWRDYSGDTLSTTKHVSPYGMQIFNFDPKPDSSDSAVLEIFVSESSVPANEWSIHVLPEIRGSPRADTMLHVALSEEGYAAFTVPWSACTTLYMVAANSNPDSSGKITATIVPGNWLRTAPGDSVVSVSRDGLQKARFTASAVRHLYGDAILSPIELNSTHKIAYDRDNLAPASVNYVVNFNNSWETGIPMTLTVGAGPGLFEREDIARELASPQAAVHRYDPWSFSWIPLATSTTPDGDGIAWSCNIGQPGLFAVLQPKSDAVTVTDTMGDLRVSAEILVPVLNKGIPELRADVLDSAQEKTIAKMGYEQIGASAFLTIPTEWDFAANPEIVLQLCGGSYSTVSQLPDIASPLTSIYHYESHRLNGRWKALSTRPNLGDTCGTWRAVSGEDGTFAVLFPLFDTVSVSVRRGGSEAELWSILSRHLSTNKPTITKLQKTEHLERLAMSQNLKSTGLPLYDIRVPDTWAEAGIKSAFGVSANDELVDTLRETNDFLPAFTRLYRMESRAGNDSVWYDMGVGSRDSIWSWTTVVEESGTFGLFQQIDEEVRFYPNPVSIRRQQDLVMDGQDILDVTIYTIAGDQVARVQLPGDALAFTQTKDGVLWHLKNNSGESVAPGTYIAVVGYKSLLTRGKELTRKKILVHP